jgi:hypothetical protein
MEEYSIQFLASAIVSLFLLTSYIYMHALTLSYFPSPFPLLSFSLSLLRPFSAAAGAKDAHHHDDHHGHHDHRVFHPEEWNPFGAPLAILVTVVGGGTAIIYSAYSLQMSKWTPPS